jgi:hypothetical protein
MYDAGKTVRAKELRERGPHDSMTPSRNIWNGY